MRSTLLIFILTSLAAAAAPEGDDFRQTQSFIDQSGPVATEAITSDVDEPPSLAVVRFYLDAPQTPADVRESDVRCLATLIAPDLVVTNAHCAPPADLVPLMRVIFPATRQYPAEVTRVSAVVERFALTEDPLRDVAVLKLARASTRPPVTIDPTGPRVGQTVQFFGAREDAGHLRLERQRCAVVPGGPNHRADDVTVRLETCAVRDGDSGGPILNHAGQLIGVIWGGTEVYAAGVNAACVPALGGTHACAQRARTLIDKQATVFLDDTATELREHAQLVVRHQTLDHGKVRVYFAPVCATRVPRWSHVIEGRAMLFDVPAADTFLPLDQTLPFARDFVTYVIEPTRLGDVKLTTTLGASKRPITQILPRCR